MASIRPFAALRPVPEAAAAVAAVPYDVVTTDEARALAAGNPLSFLHVSRAEIDLPSSVDVHADAVYERAAENLRDLRARAPLVQEDRAAFYVYRLQMGSHVQTGVAACFSLDEYDAGLIKKHEKTRPDKEDDRTRHLLAIGAQTGPVFLTYAASSAIDASVARTVAQVPLFDFVAVDGIRHTVWTVSADEGGTLVSGFAAVASLYIADGHHRAASASRARRALAARRPGEHDAVLAVAFPDNQVRILPYNRVVKDLRGRSAEQFVAEVSRTLPTTDAPNGEGRAGHAAMYVARRWYTLDLETHKGQAQGPDALDVGVLQDKVLAPLLDIQDVRTSQRIDFVGGIRGTSELERLVDSGAWAAAFSLAPVALAELMAVSDAGGIMPPKSTWFEPKLRDGLLSHLI